MGYKGKDIVRWNKLKFYISQGKSKDTLYGLEIHPNLEVELFEPLNLLLSLTWNNRLHDKLKENIQVDLEKSFKVDKNYNYILDESIIIEEVPKSKRIIINI